MGEILQKIKVFATKDGLTNVHFHKKWHRYDVYTAYKKVEE